MSSNGSFEAIVAGQFEAQPDWYQAHLSSWEELDMAGALPLIAPISSVAFLGLQIETECRQAAVRYHHAKQQLDLETTDNSQALDESLLQIRQANNSRQIYETIYSDVEENLVYGADYIGAIELALQAQLQLIHHLDIGDEAERVRLEELALHTCARYAREDGMHFKGVHAIH